MKLIEHSRHSSYRARLLEHLFVGELQKLLWKAGPTIMEVLQPQVDHAGYDLVLECSDVCRHVQLKSSYLGARTSAQNVHTSLSTKPAGCVVWIQFDQHTLDLGPFWWWGGKPHERMPAIDGEPPARHTKGNSTGFKAERPLLRRLRKSRFERVGSMEDLAVRLFGKLPVIG